MNIYNKELSIQITLSGFSFSIDTPEMHESARTDSYDFDSCLAQQYYLPSVVEWSLPSALVVPYDIFDHRSIDNYLLAASMLDPQTQRSIFAVRGEYAVVWSVERELYDYLDQRLVTVEHSHPLLRLLQYRVQSPSVVFEVDSALILHIVVWGAYGLEAAHSVKINGVEDILFYIKTLTAERKIDDPKLYYSGDIDSSALEFMSNFYNGISKI